MRVLLRQSNTGLYYAGERHWTVDMRSAFDFAEVERAIKTGREEKLTGVEVVLSFEDGRDDPVLPLPTGQVNHNPTTS